MLHSRVDSAPGTVMESTTGAIQNTARGPEALRWSASGGEKQCKEGCALLRLRGRRKYGMMRIELKSFGYFLYENLEAIRIGVVCSGAAGIPGGHRLHGSGVGGLIARPGVGCSGNLR